MGQQSPRSDLKYDAPLMNPSIWPFMGNTARRHDANLAEISKEVMLISRSLDILLGDILRLRNALGEEVADRLLQRASDARDLVFSLASHITITRHHEAYKAADIPTAVLHERLGRSFVIDEKELREDLAAHKKERNRSQRRRKTSRQEEPPQIPAQQPQVEPRVPVGGRLRKFRNAWRGIPAPLWIREIIREGYKIQFWKEPRFNHLSPPKRLCKISRVLEGSEFQRFQIKLPADHQGVKAISEEVRSLLEKQAIEEVPRDTPGVVSNIFVTSKSSGKLRPVVDLRLLNQSVKKERFKMETLQSILPLIHKEDWLTSIDLKDAFLHVPVHQESRKYLQFIWGDRKYQFKVLPFGLTSSPRIFTKVLRPVLTVCRNAGIRVAAYLDDLLIAASSIEESKMHTQMLI
ncbi:uncharacterized protein VTP21DRAFT_1109, partial [Calcarisporiella thermophila]|uniref:uncharacterized protein n=1 Tax=Calcarisporiella thermophila TaxID=911321 RepID=UPI003743B908